MHLGFQITEPTVSGSSRLGKTYVCLIDAIEHLRRNCYIFKEFVYFNCSQQRNILATFVLGKDDIENISARSCGV